MFFSATKEVYGLCDTFNEPFNEIFYRYSGYLHFFIGYG